MKILVAIESSNNSKNISNTLRWAARSGFDIRIFVPADEVLSYIEAIEDVNYKYYLDLTAKNIVTDNIKYYARANNYSLILYLSDNMKRWKDHKSIDDNVLIYAENVMAMRLRFNNESDLKRAVFPNNCIMEKVF